MADTRQTKQDNQLNGVDGMSHLDSKSQENKPLENKTSPPRETRRKGSSQEKQRQEIIPNVTQPGSEPKHFQPNPDPIPPLDQILKHQDVSINPLAVKSASNKKTKPQGNPPQEIRSNQETTRQPVELQETEPRKVEHQKVERQKVERQGVEIQKVEGVDPREGRQNITPFSNSDHNPTIRANLSLAQIGTKPQEINSNRLTRDHDEYTAPRVQNNTTGQHRPKTNPPTSKKHVEHLPVEIKSEAEEIQPQETKPQDIVPIKFSSGRPALNSDLSIHSQSFREDKTDNQKTHKGKLPAKPKKKSPFRLFKGTSAKQAKTEESPQDNASIISPEKKHNSPFGFLKGALAKQVKTEELSQDDVIIAVMGPTGAGKSTFIKLATGYDTGVGHNLESCTSEINIVKLTVPELADGDVVFVDTPGFDDTHKSDTDILKMVADWLKATYENKILLSGLLYFHRISDNRMAGTPLKNLRMFEELCGKNSFQNVILTTTMWDEVDHETGVSREGELKSIYWRTMLERGSTTSRFMQTRESALHLIEPLIDTANSRSALLLQEELVDMRTQLPATSAGIKLFEEVESLVKRRQVVLDQIRKALKNSNEDEDEDKTTLPGLQDEYQRLKAQLDGTVNEMRQLKLPLAKRLTHMTRKWFPFKLSF